MSERFYFERPNEPPSEPPCESPVSTGKSTDVDSGQSVVLEGPEARHIGKVMRLGLGDQVTLFDGSGMECQATIEKVGKNSVSLIPDQWKLVNREAATRVVAAVALPKGDRLKMMIEKLTELGGAKVIPVNFQRSSVRPRQNAIDKMRRYVIEASKQCRRNVLMEIGEPMCVNDLLMMPGEQSHRFVCLPGSEAGLEKSLADIRAQPGSEVWFLVGPEGGFTNEEMAIIEEQKKGWVPVSLGERILRTETAIIASCAIATL